MTAAPTHIRAPSVRALNAILAGRRPDNLRLATSLSLSYLSHIALALLVLYLARRHPAERPGSWGQRLVNVTPVYTVGPPRGGGGTPRPSAPEPARPAPAPAPMPAPPAAQPKVVADGSLPAKSAAKLPRPAPGPVAATGALARPAAYSGPAGPAGPGPDNAGPGDAHVGSTPAGALSGSLGGFEGGGGIDDWYKTQVRDTVYANWTNPFANPQALPRDVHVTVSFRILRSGRIDEVQVENPSPLAEFDRAALRAVRNAELPPLPPGVPADSVRVRYTFDLTPSP